MVDIIFSRERAPSTGCSGSSRTAVTPEPRSVESAMLTRTVRVTRGCPCALPEPSGKAVRGALSGA